MKHSDFNGPVQAQSPSDLSDFLELNRNSDTPLAVSMFADVKAQRIESSCLSLRQLQARLTGTTAPEKSALPLIKLATFGDARTEKGSLRHDENLLSVSGVEGDYDAGAVTPQDAAERLSQAGIAALIYTTPSHTEKAPRWRVLAPLATHVAPAEREALCARLNGALGDILAAESFTPSQSFYFGGVTARPVVSFLVEGQTLDRATGIRSIGPAPKPVKSTTDLSDLFGEPADRSEVRRALALVKDADDREQWRQIGMALHAEFNGSDEGFDLWSHWSRQSALLMAWMPPPTGIVVCHCDVSEGITQRESIHVRSYHDRHRPCKARVSTSRGLR